MNSYEFVRFIHKICKNWGWTNHQNLSKREIEGYNPVYQFSLNSNSVREIYELSGPCADFNKNQEFKHSSNLRKLGSHSKIYETKNKIINLIPDGLNTSRKLAFELGIGIQNIQRPLKILAEEGIITRISKNGKYHYKLN
jgi:predicted HTH transcriptional regulator